MMIFYSQVVPFDIPVNDGVGKFHWKDLFLETFYADGARTIKEMV